MPSFNHPEKFCVSILENTPDKEDFRTILKELANNQKLLEATLGILSTKTKKRVIECLVIEDTAPVEKVVPVPASVEEVVSASFEEVVPVPVPSSVEEVVSVPAKSCWKKIVTDQLPEQSPPQEKVAQSSQESWRTPKYCECGTKTVEGSFFCPPCHKKKTPCNYGTRCTKKGCPYLHTIDETYGCKECGAKTFEDSPLCSYCHQSSTWCYFGENCTNENCNFKH